MPSRFERGSASVAEPDEREVEEQIGAQIRALSVEAFLVATCSSLASLAYGRLETGELPEARAGMAALGALTPLVGEGVRRDFKAALASLKVAFEGASQAPEAPPA